MKHCTLKPALAALFAGVVLAGCAGTGEPGKMDMVGNSGTAGTTANGYYEGRSDDAAMAASGTSAAGAQGGSAMAAAPAGSAATQSSQGVVQAIEPLARQDTGMGVSGAPGAAAVGGMVPGVGPERVYRVTLRTDEGTMQSVVVQAAPDYGVGDRVTYRNGSLARQ